MARWARVHDARNWHLTIATATADLRRTVCGFVLRPSEALAAGELPGHGQHCCSRCLLAYVADGSDAWVHQAFKDALR